MMDTSALTTTLKLYNIPKLDDSSLNWVTYKVRMLNAFGEAMQRSQQNMTPSYCSTAQLE